MSSREDPIEIDEREIPAVASPYEGAPLTNADHVKISAYWFATNFIWGPLLLIMLPQELAGMAPYHKVEALGLVTGLTAFVALFVPLVFGALSDRCASRWGRRRPYMAAGIGINLFGLAFMAASVLSAPPIGKSPHGSALGVSLFILSHSQFLLFLISYVVVQFGNNVALAAYSGVIPDLVPHEQRGKASGYMALMSQCGTFLGLVLIELVLPKLFGDSLSHSMLEVVKYLVLGLVLVGAALVTLCGIRETPLPSRPPKIKWGLYLRSLWINPRKYPDFAWVWITRALVMLGFYAVLPYLSYFLGDVIGVKDPAKFMTILSVIIVLVSALSGFFGGTISDRIGRKKVVYLANTMMAVVSIGFIFCRNVWEVMAAGVLFGLGYGAYISVDWALGTDVLPSRNDAAKEMAVWHVAMTLPQAIAGPIAGLLIEEFGTRTDYLTTGDVTHYTLGGYTAMFVLCSVCFGLGAYFLRNVRKVE